jgi:hypothetical protein
MSVVFFTIAAKNYFAHAKTLLNSLKKHHPDAQLFLILCDEPNDEIKAFHGAFKIISASDIGIPQWNRFSFKYTLLECNTAIKPFAFGYLFEKTNADKIIYLDPDTFVYAPLSEVTTHLEKYSLVLTPHLTSPLPLDGKRPDEATFLSSGAYNLGFCGFSRSEDSKQIIKWWAERLYSMCHSDTERGLFVDQKWMDLIPGMFDSVAILRHPGYNVAYWNLHSRSLSIDSNGKIIVNGQSLVFYHFSGFWPLRPEQQSSFSDRHILQSNSPALKQLFSDYRIALFNAGYEQIAKWPYAYATLSDGTKIKHAWRLAFLAEHASLSEIDDPFNVCIHPEYCQCYENAAGECKDHNMWRANYYRLAESFPVNFLLWLRRRILRIPDSAQ